jgi:competence protein ComEC
MLVDGGGASDTFDLGRAVLAPLLWDRGIRHLDVVVATHPQLDHIGGLRFIIEKFDVAEFWSNGVARPVPFVTRLEEALERRGVSVTAVSDSLPAKALGACGVTVLNPRAQPDGRPLNLDGRALNNASVVLRVVCGRTAFLMTGDMEREAEAGLLEAAVALESTVLKVPHHGSRGSVHEEFLKSVKPTLAVISVGRGNTYGHPHPTMLEAYARKGIQVLRTDRNGAVTVLTGPSGLTVMCESGRRMKRLNGRHAESEALNVRRLLGWSSSCHA